MKFYGDFHFQKHFPDQKFSKKAAPMDLKNTQFIKKKSNLQNQQEQRFT